MTDVVQKQRIICSLLDDSHCSSLEINVDIVPIAGALFRVPLPLAYSTPFLSRRPARFLSEAGPTLGATVSLSVFSCTPIVFCDV